MIHSQGKDDIVMSPEMEKAMRGMRNFLFENVYHNPLAKREEKKVRHLLQELYQYYIEHPLELSEEYLNLMDAGQEKERVVCDYIAGDDRSVCHAGVCRPLYSEGMAGKMNKQEIRR